MNTFLAKIGRFLGAFSKAVFALELFFERRLT
jgi:hypothetical protein